MRITKLFLITVKMLIAAQLVSGQDPFLRNEVKAGELTWQGDLSARMVAGIDSFLTNRIRTVQAAREKEWALQSRKSEAEWESYIEGKRAHLKKIWGIAGTREKPSIQVETNPATLEPVVAIAGAVKIYAVKWSVAEGLDVMALLLQPAGSPKARIVLVPDAGQTPEQLCGLAPGDGDAVFPALELARRGVQVLVPTLISRDYEFSGSNLLNIHTNQPHREWIYRQGFNVGRHIIGYELQRIASCVDWLQQQNLDSGPENVPIGLSGYGEGGMLALFWCAVDPRVSALLVSGYGGNSDDFWKEPIYRNLHGSLQHAGNAELLAMSAHAGILVEYAESPHVHHPVLAEGRRPGAAPGILETPPFTRFQREIGQARSYRKTDAIRLISDNGRPFKQAYSLPAIKTLCSIMGIPAGAPALSRPASPPYWIHPRERERLLFTQLETLIQGELDTCERTRNRTFWKQISHDTKADLMVKKHQRELFHQAIGKIEDPLLPPSPKGRLLEATSKWRTYEIVLDVWPGVFSRGILVVPASVDQKQRHPVVVCQHGLEGYPEGLITRDTSDRKFRIYKSMGLVLAERGYVVFLPQNPYRGEDLFRVLQRKANPIGLSLFSVIAGQHRQIVRWLGSLSFVDKEKIGFYGLSYGGKTAMRIPALVEGYALSVCSGDFNEWARKVASTRLSYSYQFTKEYEIYEWDLGHGFNYAELAALIAPRPFMVEYGYRDGISAAEWVGYEFGKVRKHYDLSGLSDRLDIDLFDGVHEIHGLKTFPFLDKHLKNPHQ